MEPIIIKVVMESDHRYSTSGRINYWKLFLIGNDNKPIFFGREHRGFLVATGWKDAKRKCRHAGRRIAKQLNVPLEVKE